MSLGLQAVALVLPPHSARPVRLRPQLAIFTAVGMASNDDDFVQQLRQSRAQLNATLLAELEGARRTKEEWMARLEAHREFAEFSEPDGMYELDFDELAELQDGLKNAELRRLSNGLPARGNPLDDEGSILYKLMYDPVDGLRRQVDRKAAAAKLKRRINPIVRPALVLGCACSSYASPMRTARTLVLLGGVLHLLAPAVQLARDARDARTPSPFALSKPSDDRTPPLASASQVLCAQHLLSATASIAVGACLLRAGAILDGFLFLALSRACMLLGLWYWRDLNAALLAPPLLITGKTHPTVAPRLWRLATSGLCIAEASLFLRLFLAGASLPGSATVSQALLIHRLPAPLPACATIATRAVAPRALLSGPLLAASAALSSVAALLPSRHLASAAAAVSLAADASLRAPPFDGAAALSVSAARTPVVAFLTYAMWWVAFPAEGFSRRCWEPCVLPKRPPVRTLSTALLSWLRVARQAPGVVELGEMQRVRSALPTPRPGWEDAATLNDGAGGAFNPVGGAQQDLLLIGMDDLVDEQPESVELLQLLEKDVKGREGLGPSWDRAEINLPPMSKQQAMKFALLNWASSPSEDIQNLTITPIRANETNASAPTDGQPTGARAPIDSAAEETTVLNSRAAAMAAKAAGMVAAVPKGLLPSLESIRRNEQDGTTYALDDEAAAILSEPDPELRDI
ncbi:hypothetical protein AB1Y20_009386 [Prymnesium parvum]|uniref:Uncharacterized protein n=1 Tax=Prymnesium parvum TaxID=97485 RepID=A0AB34K4F3_PRYPA